MTPDDELHDLFSRQASRAPDPLALQGKVHEALDRRRRRHQIAAVVSASLAVTGLALGVRSIAQPHETTPERLATPPSATSPPVVVSATPLGDVPGLEAFFSHGYTYDDAVVLAQLWKGDPFECKAVAGQVILDGGTLPIRHGQSRSQAQPTSISITADRAAFTHAGYTDADALALAELWNTGPDVPSISAIAGQLLLDGKHLPLAPQ